MSNDTYDATANRGNMCPVCGEPLGAELRVHADCAQHVSADDTKTAKNPPQKTCLHCGHKTHVRKLECPKCGTLF